MDKTYKDLLNDPTIFSEGQSLDYLGLSGKLTAQQIEIDALKSEVQSSRNDATSARSERDALREALKAVARRLGHLEHHLPNMTASHKTQSDHEKAPGHATSTDSRTTLDLTTPDRATQPGNEVAKLPVSRPHQSSLDDSVVPDDSDLFKNPFSSPAPLRAESPGDSVDQPPGRQCQRKSADDFDEISTRPQGTASSSKRELPPPLMSRTSTSGSSAYQLIGQRSSDWAPWQQNKAHYDNFAYIWLNIHFSKLKKSAGFKARLLEPEENRQKKCIPGNRMKQTFFDTLQDSKIQYCQGLEAMAGSPNTGEYKVCSVSVRIALGRGQGSGTRTMAFAILPDCEMLSDVELVRSENENLIPNADFEFEYFLTDSGEPRIALPNIESKRVSTRVFGRLAAGRAGADEAASDSLCPTYRILPPRNDVATPRRINHLPDVDIEERPSKFSRLDN